MSMISIPFDENGDFQPRLLLQRIMNDPEVVAKALRDYLQMMVGEWWEDALAGNPVFDLMSVLRATDAAAETLAACLTDYISRYPGFRNISETSGKFDGSRFTFHCKVTTGDGIQVPVDFTA